MNEYDYFIEGFDESVDSEYVRQLIMAQENLAPTFSTLMTDNTPVEDIIGVTITVLFTDALSSPNQALLAGLMATYMSSVPVAKLKKLSALTLIIQNFIESKYPLLTRLELMNLYTLAKFDSLSNRASYIRPGLDWINEIIAYAVSCATAIKALTVFDDVQNYAIDVAGNVSADPLLTVGAAILIAD